MANETGKQRAAGIPLDYFRHRNPLDRGKLALAGIAAVATIGWLVAGFIGGPRAEARYSPGPLNAVHATWENDCLKCHTRFTPITTDAAVAVDITSINRKCQACHDVSNSASPLGHFASKNPALLACSSCHHEHRGAAGLLGQMADTSCADCHARIAEHCLGPSLLKPPARDVSRFDAEHHPEFRSITTDPRKLKFTMASHNRHMTDGFGWAATQEPLLTVAMLRSEADRLRYAPGQTNEKALVHGLTCGACHQPDVPSGSRNLPAGSASATLRSDPAGAYMRPIVFENHCQACHALTIDPEQVAKSNSKSAPDVIRHGLEGPELTAEVQRYWAARYLHDHPQQTGPLPLPGHAGDDAAHDAREWVNGKVAESLAHLRRNCLECHVLARHATGNRPADDDELARILSPSVQPVNIPRRWFKHARFDHAAHRSVNCTECHVGADPAARTGPIVKIASPMIPGRDTCIVCHSPPQAAAAPPHGTARYNCLECHEFHTPAAAPSDPRP